MKKQTIIMIGIIVVLSVIALIAVNIGPNKKASREIAQSILGEINIKDIKSIEINDDIVLSLDEKMWSYMVENETNSEMFLKPTRQDHVQNLLTTLSNFGRGRLIDSAPDDLEKYNLSDLNNANTIRLLVLKGSDDEELIRIKIGISVGVISVNYALVNDDSAVYHIDESLAYFLNQSEQYWLDLRLFPKGIESDRVKSIEITKKESPDILLNKNNDEWIFPNNTTQKLNIDAIDSYINDFSTIKAYNFESPELRDELLNGSITLTYLDDTETKLTLFYFANKYFATTIGGQDTETSFLQEYSINKLFPNIDVFIDESVQEKDLSTDIETDDDKN